MSRWSALHPFLIALYLVLRLVAVNAGETYLEEAVRSLAILLGCVAVAFAGLRIAYGSGAQAGVLISSVLMLTCSFDAVRSVLSVLADGWSEAQVYWVLFGTWLVIVAVLALIVHRFPRRVVGLVPALNMMAGVLLLFPIAQMGWRAVFDDAGLWSPSPATAGARDVLALDTGGEEPRDIYLIVLDAYARADVLRDFYSFDNSEFLADLKEQGFFVAEQSRTNFTATRLVLPSLLNFRYLDDLARELGKNSKNTEPLSREVRENRVVAALREFGYRIVSIQSGVGIPKFENADEAFFYDVAGRTLNRFESVLLRMTPLIELLDRLLPEASLSPSEIRRRRLEYALDQLGAQGERPGPKFVYAHILAPHDPFVFGPNGEERSLHMRLFHPYPESRARVLGEAYADQVEYLNGRVSAVIDRILADSARDPIVILMGDHGLRLQLRGSPNSSCLRETFAILNAIRLPPVGKPNRGELRLYDTMSPVNTFRTVFDAYFGTDLGQLPDRSLFSNRSRYYDFTDVTDRAETCSVEANR
jgi:hypothetical protein